MKQKKIIYLLLVNTIINLFIFSKIKIILYRSLLRYKISYKASLGIFSFIIAENVEICTGAKIGCFVLLLDNKKIILRENAKIYRFVKVLGLNSFYLGKNAIIGVDTCVISRHKDRYNNNVVSGGRFIVGDKTIITNKHMFDVLGNILIKRNVVIGGAYSLFYTHGFDCYGNISYGDIILNGRIYIGARALFLPGVKVMSEIIVGAGTVVSKSLKEKGVYVGNPVRKISNNPVSIYKLIRK